MVMDDIDIVLLPGLGANRRLFTPQIKAFVEARVQDWPTPDAAHPDRPDAFARKLLENLDLGERAVLVGFSFGGQIALSAARLLAGDRSGRRLAVVLISAPRTHRQLTDAFHRRASVVRRTPRWALRPIATMILAPLFCRSLGLRGPIARTVRLMASELDPGELVHHAALARAWSFTEDDHRSLAHAGVTVRHLHAVRDPVIPPPEPGVPGLTRIDERAHLLTLTHTDTVNAAIRDAAASLM
jgi:pimeloyl-ACP methyl ester carboxylesterase